MRTTRLHVASLAALAGVLACQSELTTGGGTGGLTTGQAIEIGTAAQSEIESEMSGITAGEAGAPVGFSYRSATGFSGPNGLAIAGCPTVSSTTDADADGIPDDATFSFTNPPCSVTGWRGGTFALTGDVRILDTNQGNGFDFTATFTDFMWEFTGPGGVNSWSATRNGTRARTGTTNAASLTVDMLIEWRRPARAMASLHKTGTVLFTADTPGSLHANQPLPDGTFDITGTLTWQRASEDYSFAITTPVPLHYDASCTLTPQRIDSGELHADGTVNGVTGTLIVTWTACGTEPTVQWVTTLS